MMMWLPCCRRTVKPGLLRGTDDIGPGSLREFAHTASRSALKCSSAHWKTVVLKGQNITVDCFTDIHDGGFPALALRNAAWKTWAFRHPKAVLPG